MAGAQDRSQPRASRTSPQTNGFGEGLHRTLKEESFSVALRKKVYGSLRELQDDLDAWLVF